MIGRLFCLYPKARCIKHSTIGENDWAYSSIDTVSFIEAGGSSELYGILLNAEDGQELDTDMSMDSAYRDGCFDEGQQFMVYSRQDAEQLIGLLSQTLNMDAYKEDTDK